MKLEALEVFCEVARRRSFSRGAAAIGVSQSAASQLIAHLERELDVRLMDRTRRPFVLTPVGELYLKGCQEILDQHRALLEKIRRPQPTPSGSVRVVSIYSAGLHTLAPSIQRFMSLHSGATVRLEYFHPSRVQAAILNEEADLGVTSYPAPNRQIEVIPWVEEEMVLVCPPGHPLAQRRSLALRELAGASFVAFDRDLKIRREIDRAMKQRHVAVRIASEFDNIETIKQALEVSRAITILPTSSIEKDVQRGTLVKVKIDDIDLRRPVGIIHKKRKRLTRTAEQFIASLVDS